MDNFQIKDCFSDEDMFFGGSTYKYSWEKHSLVAKSKAKEYRLKGINEDKVAKIFNKLEKYKDFDGVEFVYNVDYPSDGCILTTTDNVRIRFYREWCNKIIK